MTETAGLFRGGVDVAGPWRERLEAAGLDTLAALAAAPGEARLRAVPGRETLRLRLADGTALYLKRHRRPAGRGAVAAVLGAARREYDALGALAAAGIPVPEAVACGGGLLGDAAVAVVVTREIPGGEQADCLLGRRRGRPGRCRCPELAPRDRPRLLRRIGDLAGRLHRAGWVHQDLYFCHFFAVAADPDLPVYLIDLQRVTRPGGLRFAGRRLKDLGALDFAAWECALTRPERAELWAAYREAAALPRWRLGPYLAAARVKALGIRRRDLRRAREGRP
ncbi:hypothetical protein HCU62_03610 [Dissulfurirhabdus thermomarina]|nr:hypothetical protein [Dissulfurirhabdus thermomarina]